MTRKIIVFLTSICGLGMTKAVSAHDYFVDLFVPAGYKHDMELRVPHGCKGSPVKEVHVQIPQNVQGVTIYYNRDWKIETKMRKLPAPIRGEGGVTLTETVDEIIWKNPTSVLPGSGMFDSFKFRVTLPKEPGQVLWFKTYDVCEKGEERWVEVPKETLTADMPDFAAKFGKFMLSVPGPAPYVVLTKPARPQYPWGDTPTPAPAGSTSGL